MRKIILAWFVVADLCYVGCVLGAEGGRTLPAPDPHADSGTTPPTLEIRAPRHDASNDPRIIIGREYACLTTVEIANPNDAAAYVSTLEISARPAIAFETVAAEWADDPSKLPRAAMPDIGGKTTIVYPDVGMRILPRSSRYLRLCGVTKAVVAKGSGKGTEPESGIRISAALERIVTLNGERVRFPDEEIRPSHVLRASRPLITVTPLPPRELRAGGLNLFEWNVEAHLLGPIAFKQFAFHLNITDAKACNVRLLDDTDGPSHESETVELTDGRASRRSLRSACLDRSADIATTFRDEFRFDQDEGVHFSLRADLSDVGEKAAITVSFLRSADAVTDALACGATGAGLFAGDPAMVPGMTWSDVSAVPHSATPCGSSRDWTTDALVRDLTP